MCGSHFDSSEDLQQHQRVSHVRGLSYLASGTFDDDGDDDNRRPEEAALAASIASSAHAARATWSWGRDEEWPVCLHDNHYEDTLDDKRDADAPFGALPSAGGGARERRAGE
jgi:hypothetical protein